MHNTLIAELESLQPAPLDAGLIFSGKASGSSFRAMPLLLPTRQLSTLTIFFMKPAATLSSGS